MSCSLQMKEKESCLEISLRAICYPFKASDYQTIFLLFHIIYTFFLCCLLVNMKETKIIFRFCFLLNYYIIICSTIRKKNWNKKSNSKGKNNKFKTITLFIPNCDRKIQKYYISSYEENQVQGQEARELFIRYIRHWPDTLLTVRVQYVVVDFGDGRWALRNMRGVTVVATATGTGPSWSWPFWQRWQIHCDVMGIEAWWGLQLMLRVHVEFICEPWGSRFIQIIHFMTSKTKKYKPKIISSKYMQIWMNTLIDRLFSLLIKSRGFICISYDYRHRFILILINFIYRQKNTKS